MADLLIGTALTQIEEALRNKIRYAHLKRLPAVATVAALRATATKGAGESYAVAEGALRYVTAAALCYEWDTFSTTADNGTTVITPADAGTAGRWVRTTSAVTTGYLRAVEFYDGNFDEAKVDERLLGQRPCVVIHWDGSQNIVSSVIAGALYKYRPRFKLWCLSSNLRRRHEGKVGPEIAAEISADPGVQAIIGDLKELLAGEDLDQDGIDYCEIGDERCVTTSLAERRFASELMLTVYATTHNPESDTEDLDGFDVTTEIASKGAGAASGYADRDDNLADRDNRRVSGIEVDVGSGLTQAISSGSAYLDGALVVYAGQSKAFTASKDTYRDLVAAGTLTFVTVSAGDDEPAVTADALRIGVTTTDETSVTRDLILVPTIDVYGQIDTVPQP